MQRCAHKNKNISVTMPSDKTNSKKITTGSLLGMKANNEKIAMLTAYDFSFAKIIDTAGIDVILVGDSAANVMAGFTTTLPITLNEMIYHAQSVVRGVSHALVVVDMPFGSYQAGKEKALENAIRIIKETGAHAIKLEGGEEVLEVIKSMVSAGIPVMGHVGLTPQSINRFGTYATRATDKAEADKLKNDVQLLQQAGCFAVVVEKIPATLGKEVAESVQIPVIGIGAGPYCDGQVLVMHDMLGINEGFKPKFLRQYLHLHEQITGAVQQYAADVKSASFPNESESY
jgi:3-methyl-2-oxobutanoate hydroxymethyltransferase